MAVITFVVLAGGSDASALRSQIVSPVVASTMIAARAVTLGSDALARGATAARSTPLSTATLPRIHHLRTPDSNHRAHSAMGAPHGSTQRALVASGNLTGICIAPAH